MDKYADLTRPSETMLARGINLAHHNPGSRRSNPLLLQHTLDSTHDFEVLRGGALGTHQRFRRRYDLSGSIDDAEPPGAAPSRPCQETPADLGTPSKFVGRTSLIARRGSARPPMFFTRGSNNSPQTISPEGRDENRHRPPRTDSVQPDSPWKVRVEIVFSERT
jgi:hypothetical protein